MVGRIGLHPFTTIPLFTLGNPPAGPFAIGRSTLNQTSERTFPSDGIQKRKTPGYFPAPTDVTFTRCFTPSTVIQNVPSMPGPIFTAGLSTSGDT